MKKKAKKKVMGYQYGGDLPTAYASAPRPITSYKPIDPTLQGNDVQMGMMNSGIMHMSPQMSQAPGMVQQGAPDVSQDVDFYNQQMAGPQKKKKQPYYDGRYGKAALAGLLAVDALLPNQKDHAPVVQPLDSYNPHPYGTGSSALMEYGGEFKSGGDWIQHAVNPAHKGYCTPMTKSTCTPHRKALAQTFKKHHGFHGEDGITLSQEGYRADSPDRFETALRIPSNNISMEGVNHPVLGVDNLGNGKMMHPGEHHYFPGTQVDEYPMAQNGRNIAPSPSYRFDMSDGHVPNSSDSAAYRRGVQRATVAPAAFDDLYVQPAMSLAMQARDRGDMTSANSYLSTYGTNSNIFEDSQNVMNPQQVHNELSTLNIPQDLHRPVRRMQAGGTYTSYSQINKDNQFAKDFLRRQNAPSFLADNAVVARNIGDPVVQFIDSKTGKPSQNTMKSSLPNTLPRGVSIEDVYHSSDGQFGYQDPTYDRFVPVDPSIYNLYGRRNNPSAPPASNSTASLKAGGAMKPIKVYEEGGMMNDHYKAGTTHDMSDSEIKSLIGKGYKLKFI